MVKRWKIVSVSMRARPRPRDRKDEKEKREKRESRTKVILRTQEGERVKDCESNSKKEYERKKKLKEKNPYDRNENSVMDSDIKTSHLFLPMKKAIIRDIYERTYGSLITRNGMVSNGFEH